MLRLKGLLQWSIMKLHFYALFLLFTTILSSQVPSVPVIATGGVVGAGGSAQPVSRISPNSFGTAYGTGFSAGAPRVVTASDLTNNRLPTNLAGVCVDVDGVPAYLTLVSPSQINFLVGKIRTGTTVPVVVKTGCGTGVELASVAAMVESAEASPEFLYWTSASDGKHPVIAVNAITGALAGPPHLIPGLNLGYAHSDDYLTLFGISLGDTNPSFTPGMAAAGQASANLSTTVEFDGASLPQSDILYIGASPGTAGLYQVNLHLNPSTSTGIHTLQLKLGNQASPIGYLSVLGTSASDLTVISIPTPVNLRVGETMPSISATVENKGSGSAGAFRVALYLSPTPTVTSLSTRLPLTCQAAGLAVGATYTCTGDYPVPQNFLPGSYYLVAVADDLNQSVETNEGNNSLASTLTANILGPPGPDFVIDSVTGPSSGAVGDALHGFQVVVRNTGVATSAPFRVGISVSSSPNPSSQIATVFTCVVDGLAAGATSICSGSATLPSLPVGAFYWIGIADDLAQISEEDESNNSRVSSTRLTIGGLPDLVLTSMGSVNTAPTGATVPISATISNRGNGDASHFEIGFYLSNTNTVTVASTFVGLKCSVTTLRSGEDTTCSGNITIPMLSAPGYYYLGAIADTGGEVKESNESNNSRVPGPFFVASTLPELYVSVLTAPVAGQLGFVLLPVVALSVTNQGLTASGPFRVRMYLSTIPTWSPSAIALPDVCNISGVGPGMQAQCTVVLSVPASFPIGGGGSNLWLLTVVDDQDQVSEGNETNNVRASQIFLSAATPISVGQTVPDAFTTASSPVYLCNCRGNYYSLTLPAPTGVVIMVTSPFSTTLRIYNSSGLAVASATGINSGAVIGMGLAAGTYKLEILSGDMGSYTLSVVSP